MNDDDDMIMIDKYYNVDFVKSSYGSKENFLIMVNYIGDVCNPENVKNIKYEDGL